MLRCEEEDFFERSGALKPIWEFGEGWKVVGFGWKGAVVSFGVSGFRVSSGELGFSFGVSIFRR